MTLLPFVELPIEYLDLAGCKWLDAEDTARDICSLFYLTHLNLVCCRQISMDFISQFTSKEGGQPYLPYLQEFSISGSALIGDHVMIPFIKQYRTLKRLYLFECDISDQSLSAISTYLPHIQCLDLSFSLGVTSKGLRSLVVSCVDLVLLGLKNCNIALRDFPEIVLSSSMPVHSPHLDILYLHELGIIRAQSSNPTKELEWDQEEQQQQELSDEEQQQQEEEEEEDHTAVDDSVSESYNFIQQYLNSVSP
jgi:hypothetical protein